MLTGSGLDFSRLRGDRRRIGAGGDGAIRRRRTVQGTDLVEQGYDSPLGERAVASVRTLPPYAPLARLRPRADEVGGNTRRCRTGFRRGKMGLSEVARFV